MPDLFAQHLARAAYEGIAFPVVDAFSTPEGHDFAVFAPAGGPIDSQPTGYRPGDLTLVGYFGNEIPGWPSDLFPRVLDEMQRTLREHPRGVLTHPRRGLLDVDVLTWSETVDPHPSKRGVVRLSMSFRPVGEQPAATDTQMSPQQSVDAVENATDAMLAAAASEQENVDRHTPAGRVIRAPEAIAAEALRAASAAQSAIDAGAGITQEVVWAVRQSIRWIESHAIDPLQGDWGSVTGFRTSLESLLVALSRLARVAPAGTWVVPETMSLARCAACVYGSADAAPRLRAANSIPDERRVPAGTTLRTP